MGIRSLNQSGISLLRNWRQQEVRLLERGKTIEIFEYYEPKLQYFAEWLKQLFGESEGKDGKGFFQPRCSSVRTFIRWDSFCRREIRSFLNRSECQPAAEGSDRSGECGKPALREKGMNAVNQAAVAGV